MLQNKRFKLDCNKYPIGTLNQLDQFENSHYWLIRLHIKDSDLKRNKIDCSLLNLLREIFLTSVGLQYGPKFSQFHAFFLEIFGKIICWCAPLEGWRPLLRKSYPEYISEKQNNCKILILLNLWLWGNCRNPFHYFANNPNMEMDGAKVCVLEW